MAAKNTKSTKERVRMQFFAFYVFFVAHEYSAMIKWSLGNTKERKTIISIKALCDRVRQTSYDIHEYHGHGHLEKVYENALAPAA